MRRAGKEGEGDKVMGPLFPRLHVNDSTLKAGGGPRAPPRNKMALYEQFSVPSSQRFNAAGSTAAQAHRPAASYAVSSASAGGQVGGSDRPLFPSFCTSEHINTNSNARGSSATRAESGRPSAQLRSKDTTHAAGSTAECSSQRRDNTTTKNSSAKKATNDDNFTVPSVFCSGGATPHSARVQEKPAAPFPTTYNKSGPATTSKPSAKYSNADKRYLLEGTTNVSEDTRSQSIRDKIQAAKTATNLEVGERSSSSFKLFSTEKKTGKTDDDRGVSSYRDTRLSSVDAVSDKHQHSRTEGHFNQAGRRNEINAAAESQNAGNGALSEKGFLRETAGEKRKRSSAGHYYDDVQREDSPDSSVESLPGLEISPDDVVGAIGPKHFWKARRAIVNQQRVFAVQVFELHRLIKVQKLIAASPHLLIEGDPCLGNALVTSKKKLAAANAEKQLSSAAKSKDDDDDALLTLQQAEYSPKDNNTEGNNQDSPVEVQQNNQTDASNGAAASSNPPATAMPAPPPDNNNKNWCAAPPPPPPPPNQWLVPVMSLSEGLVYKPYSGPCPPAGSFLAPFYAGCAPLSLPSTAAGEFMASPYGIPMPHHHQPPQQHMGVDLPMPPMYFPPFSMRVVEQVSGRVAPARPKAQHVEHLSARTSCNMRNEAVSAGGIWRFHSSRDSELQGSSAASSPFDRQQGEARGGPAAPPPPPLPASSGAGNNDGPSSGGSKENPAARVIRVVPHTARTASESAARIFQSIQMERQQNDP